MAKFEIESEEIKKNSEDKPEFVEIVKADATPEEQVAAFRNIM